MSPLGQGAVGGRGGEGPLSSVLPLEQTVPAPHPGPDRDSLRDVSLAISRGSSLREGPGLTAGSSVPAAQLLWLQHTVCTDHLHA